MGFSVSANSPSLGRIAWANVHIVYEGVDYAIADGSTDKRFVFWQLATPDTFGVSDEHPALTSDDCIVFLNKGGVPISVLTATAMDGDLVVPGTVTSTAIATDAIDASHIQSDAIVARHIVAGAVTAEKLAVNELSAISANLGTMTAGNFTLDATGYIRGGAASFASGAGFWMGSDNGTYKFRAGVPGSSCMEWDGNAFNIYDSDGNLTISSGTVDYLKIGGRPSSLSDISQTESDKLASIASGATRNVYRGTWTAGTDYLIGDMVVDSDGYGWACELNHTAAADNAPPAYPETFNAWWVIHGIKGEDAVVGLLSNETVTLGATHLGEVPAEVFTAQATGVFELYKGQKRIDSARIRFSVAQQTGCAGTIDGQGRYAVTAMSADSASLKLRATYDDTSIDKVFTLSKSRGGQPGTAGVAATSYWLAATPNVVVRDAAGHYTTSVVTFAAVCQIGQDSPAPYTGRFLVETSTDGERYTSSYRSANDESSLSFTLPEGVKSVRATLYENGTSPAEEFVAVLDSTTVVIVEDGIEYDLQIESTNGTVFRVGESRNTLLRARVFRNGEDITDNLDASMFRWIRVSMVPQEPPNDDDTWNALYASGYKQISVSVDDIHARATFHCQIIK